MIRSTRLALALSALACAAAQSPAVRIVPGEILVRVADGAASADRAGLASREDVSVDGAECLNRTCRVLVSRTDGIADEAWTRALIESLARSVAPGVTVEPNVVHEAR